MKKYIGLDDMSSVNCSNVLHVIRNAKGISRRQISDITGLSWGGMTKIVNKLFEHGYIEEEKEENTAGVGRTPGLLHVTRSKNLVLGLDLNREGFEGCVMNLGGEMLRTFREKINFQSKEELLREIFSFTDKLVEEFGESQILAIGIAMQGELNAGNGISVRFPHCPDWNNVPLQALMEERYQKNVFIEHDPNCILYSLMRESECENMLLFRLDRSIGMAAAVDGQILRGSGLLEIAHCIAVPEGKRCRCQRQGCIEAYVAPCMEKETVNEKALQELFDPLAVMIYNMENLFHADRVIVTGKLIANKRKMERGACDENLKTFEQSLRKALETYEKEKKAFIQVVEETTLAVQGAALIAAQCAVDQLQF